MRTRDVVSATVVAFAALCGAAQAQEKIVGGGLKVGVAAPFALGDAQSPDKVTVAQHLYLASELGFPANSRIIDVAWRKELLAETLSPGCTFELYLKNVPTSVAEYAPGSAVKLQEAQSQATRVYQGTLRNLPAAMGFLGLHPVQNTLDFLYTGANLEVTTVVDCSAVSGSAASGAVLYRYDLTAKRGRGFRGSTSPTADTELLGRAPFSDRRPQTRFRTLVPGKRFYLRVGLSPLNNNANFAPAANYLAAGVTVPNRYNVYNGGMEAITLQAPEILSPSNVAVALTTPVVTSLAPGESKPLELDVTPTATGATQWDLRIATDDPNANPHRIGIRGTTVANAAPTPALTHVRSDGSLSANLAHGAKVSLGALEPGVDTEVTLEVSNYGSAPLSPISVTQGTRSNATVSLGSPPASLASQVDGRFTSRVRADGPGPASATLSLQLGSQVRDVVVEAEGGKPEIAVSWTALIAGSDIPNNSTVNASTTPVQVGRPFEMLFLVANEGTATLEASTPAVTALENCRVSISAGRVGPRLAPGDVALFAVKAIPTATGTLKYDVYLPNSDADESPFKWVVTAGAGVPDLTVALERGLLRRGVTELQPNDIIQPNDALATVSGDRPADNVSSMSYVLANEGTLPLEISSITSSDSRVVPSVTGPLSVAPGGRTSVAFDLEPLQRQVLGLDEDVTLTLTVASNDPQVPSYAWTVEVNGAIQTQPPAAKNLFGCASAGGPLGLLPAALALWALRRRRAFRA